jgi:hypothetical protein
MRRVWLAIRVFFSVLFHAEVAGRVEAVLWREEPKMPAADQVPKPALRAEPKKGPPPKPVQSEAITLLATLQREARFIDFIKESLGGYSDAQIGAVARDVHRDCGLVIERLFGLSPVVGQEEGSEVELPGGFDSGRFRLTGHVAGEPPFRGHLAHHGWEASRCDVPAWSGKDTAARVLAPAEVELR